MNLMEGILSECNRARELIKDYESIGSVGNFSKMMIQQTIDNAEKAIGEDADMITLMKVYEDLKENK
jgi:hypothetical protein